MNRNNNNNINNNLNNNNNLVNRDNIPMDNELRGRSFFPASEDQAQNILSNYLQRHNMSIEDYQRRVYGNNYFNERSNSSNNNNNLSDENISISRSDNSSSSRASDPIVPNINSNLSESNSALLEQLEAYDNNDNNNNNAPIDPQRQQNVENVGMILRNSLALGQRIAQTASLAEANHAPEAAQQALNEATQRFAEFVAHNRNNSSSIGLNAALIGTGVVLGGVILYALGMVNFNRNNSNVHEPVMGFDLVNEIYLGLTKKKK